VADFARDLLQGDALRAEGHAFESFTDARGALREEGPMIAATEFRLLVSLAIRLGTAKSRDALIEIACGNDVGDRTIDSHVKRLRQKFRAIDQGFDKIDTIYGAGYRFRE
jgi:two-component system response regulator ChvI